VPHTVPSTHAEALFQALPTPSMCERACAGGNASPALRVCALPRSGADLQLLRPRPDLLRRRLCAGGAISRPARGRSAQTSRRGRLAHAVRTRRFRAQQKNVTVPRRGRRMMLWRRTRRRVRANRLRHHRVAVPRDPEVTAPGCGAATGASYTFRSLRPAPFLVRDLFFYMYPW
jgi:hypothetical protein